MDTTDNFGFPYPQCNPPLTKDASDIEQLRDLAQAVDAAVQGFDDDVTENLERPDAIRLNNTGAPLTSTLADNLLLMTTLEFDNTPGDVMTDLTNGGIRIRRDGWYQLGFWISCTVPSDVQARARFLNNGLAITNWHPPGGVAVAGALNCAGTELAELGAGDLVQLQSRNDVPGASVTYNARLWAWLVLPNV